jgi:hypothetical protein
MLVEVIDAVVGVNTHRDAHEVQIASPTGTPIATVSISKDSDGYNDLITWIVQHAPGPRLAVSCEEARGYAAGLARAAAAAGLVVIESDPDHKHPDHKQGGEDQPGLIDAHGAASAALHLDADRLLDPRTEGDRDALRILLGARQDLTTTTTRQGTRLRALLLSGDDADRKIARVALTEAILVGLVRRREPREATRQHSVRQAEIRRLALALVATGRELKANRAQLQAIVDDLVPGLTDRRGIGAVNAAQAIVRLSHPSTVPKPRRPLALEAAARHNGNGQTS